MTLIYAPPRTGPFGPWTALGWILLSYLVAQLVGLLTVMVWSPGSSLRDAGTSGDLVTLALATSTPLQVAIIWYAAQTRTDPVDYLALHIPSWRHVVVGIVAAAVVLAGSDGADWLVGHRIITPFQVATYTSARSLGWIPELWFAFVVLAPVGEEMLFRGFAYRAFSDTMGPRLAVTIIAAVWASLHLQYGLVDIVQIFGLGLVLGAARAMSGTVVLPIILHSFMNLWAMTETILLVR